jgi:signal transduction histidine kinase
LAALLEGIDDAVIATDPERQVRFMNLAAEALTGWRREDAVSAQLGSVCNLVEGGTRIPLNAFEGRAVCECRPIPFPAQTLLVDRSGHDLPVEGCLCPMYDPRGVFLGVALTMRNIFARLDLERLQRQNAEQARQAEKMEAVRRLAGGMACQLKNLLTVILRNTALALSRSSEESEIMGALGRAEAAGHRAAGLIRRLLFLAGQDRGHLRQVDLSALLPEFMNTIKPHLDSRITVVCNPVSNLWQVNADAVQMGQVLLNLCLNAQDAMPLGGRLVLESTNIVFAEEDLPNHPGGRLGDFVRIRVSDTGQGLAPEARARLFEPFFTSKGPGDEVGLGLAFVYTVVEQHHGWIECFSNVGRGTQFDMYLPVCNPCSPD